MKKEIDKYFNNLEIIPDKDFIINDVVILNKNIIKFEFSCNHYLER